jgi:hypothetical protein
VLLTTHSKRLRELLAKSDVRWSNRPACRRAIDMAVSYQLRGGAP